MKAPFSRQPSAISGPGVVIIVKFDSSSSQGAALSPLEERVARDGAFTSRRGPGLRPPKGYWRSRRAARYGPQAGEGGANLVLPIVRA